MKLEAGRELDALIAERVMRITKANPDEYGQEQWNDNGVIFRRLPAYSSDISAAWEVMEVLLESYEVEILKVKDHYHVVLTGAPDREGVHPSIKVKAETAPLAICFAIVKAKGIEL